MEASTVCGELYQKEQESDRKGPHTTRASHLLNRDELASILMDTVGLYIYVYVLGI